MKNLSLHSVCIQKGKRKSSFNDTHNSISSCREIGTKTLGLTIFKAFISKGVVETGKIVFEKISQEPVIFHLFGPRSRPVLELSL